MTEKNGKNGMNKKILIALAAALLLLGGSVAVLPGLLWGDAVDYSKVASIRTTGVFQEPRFLNAAWQLPVAKTYRTGLDFQHNGSFCGPTSVVNLSRSIGMPATQATILNDSGISTVLGALPGGITLDQLSELAGKKLKKHVTMLRDLSLAEFRQQMVRTNDPSVRYLINFHRGPLFGQGSGHHSPIAGYLAAEDLVFVLDVNASYKPWLVKTERLYEAQNTTDPASGKKRGLLRIE